MSSVKARSSVSRTARKGASGVLLLAILLLGCMCLTKYLYIQRKLDPTYFASEKTRKSIKLFDLLFQRFVYERAHRQWGWKKVESFSQEEEEKTFRPPEKSNAGNAGNLSDAPTIAQNNSGVPRIQNDPLRVYMYGLPPELNWLMIVTRNRPTVNVQGPGLFESDPFPNKTERHWAWKGHPGNYSARFPVYAGNPSVQQHATEFYLYLSLLQGLPSIVRVADPSEAEVFFAPFFASLCYNANILSPEVDKKHQSNFVSWLKSQPYWKNRKGRDHVVVAAHPNALWYKMPELNTTVLLVADFSRSAASGAYFEKDVVVPYKAFVSPLMGDCNSSHSWNRRKVLAYFLGRLKRKSGGYIREKLKELFAGEEDILMIDSRPSKGSIPTAEEGLAGSKFCLMPAGDTPSSCRLYDAIMRLCVPVVISQSIELPYEDVLDYSTFCVIVPTAKALTAGYLPSLLRNISQTEWEFMHQKLIEVRPYFMHAHPAQVGGAEDMIWQAITRKIRGEQLTQNRDKRLALQGITQDPPSSLLVNITP